MVYRQFHRVGPQRLKAAASARAFMLRTSVAALSIALAAPLTAFAQSKSASTPADATSGVQLQEVVVTARRVSERLQDIPASVSAVGADQIKKMSSLADIQSLVAGVTFKNLGPIVTVGMRGYGNRQTTQAANSTVGIFQDGVFIAPFLNALDSRIDVSRIEVAKGPQSTLYGRSSYTGAINIVTSDPTPTFSGYLDAGVGGSSSDGEGLWHVQGVVSGPLTDNLSGRVFFLHEERDGYTYDPTNNIRGFGYDRTAGRVKLKWTPTDDLTVRLAGTLMHDNSPTGYVQGTLLPPLGNQALFGDPAIPAKFPTTSNIWEGSFARQPVGRVNGQEGTLDVRYKTPVGELAWLSDYQHSDTFIHENGDTSLARDADAFSITDEDRFSQEVRLSGKSDKFSYLVGLYYLNTDFKSGGGSSVNLDDPFAQLYPGAFFYDDVGVKGLYIPTQTKTNAYAVFAQVGYNITDRLNLTAGIREGRDEIRAVTQESLQLIPGFLIPAQAKVHQAANYDATTGSANLSYKFDRDSLVYVSYSRGDAPGGFNTGAVAAFTYAPQTVDAYEVGLKAEGLDRHLRANVAVFDNEYHNIQTFQAVPIEGFVQQVITNASAARGQGVDLDTTYVFSSDWRVNIQYTHQTSKITSYTVPPPPFLQLNFVGVPLVRSPEDSLNASLTFTHRVGPGKLEFTPEVTYTSSYINDYQGAPAGTAYPGRAGVPAGVTTSQVLALYRSPGYVLTNLNASYTLGDWQVSAYVRNLFNKQYVAALAAVDAISHPLEAPGEPRTFEFSLRKSF